MQVVDFSSVILSNLFVALGKHTNAKITVGMLQHMILNSLRSSRSKFRSEYGELVIACDGKNTWRRRIFPYYKASRKKAREASELDWGELFEMIAQIRDEIREVFPYPVVHVDEAEADDVIYTMVKNFFDQEPILILSADKDFKQLHRFQGVRQFDPIDHGGDGRGGRWIQCDDPAQYLREHVLRGDTGDGVPNILSPDNCLVVGQRQKPMTKKRLEFFLNEPIESWPDEEHRRNFHRNSQLIDLRNCPEQVEVQILDSYSSQLGKGREKLFNYFTTNRLKVLTESIGDF